MIIALLIIVSILSFTLVFFQVLRLVLLIVIGLMLMGWNLCRLAWLFLCRAVADVVERVINRRTPDHENSISSHASSGRVPRSVPFPSNEP